MNPIFGSPESSGEAPFDACWEMINAHPAKPELRLLWIPLEFGSATDSRIKRMLRMRVTVGLYALDPNDSDALHEAANNLRRWVGAGMP